MILNVQYTEYTLRFSVGLWVRSVANHIYWSLCGPTVSIKRKVENSPLDNNLIQVFFFFSPRVNQSTLQLQHQLIAVFMDYCIYCQSSCGTRAYFYPCVKQRIIPHFLNKILKSYLMPSHLSPQCCNSLWGGDSFALSNCEYPHFLTSHRQAEVFYHRRICRIMCAHMTRII